MTFLLSASDFPKIIFAMENQKEQFLWDAKNCQIVCAKDFVCDEENFYSLPGWTSADGFAMLEDFVSNLHSPQARSELEKTLSLGKGVFKEFKNVLKFFPQCEKRFYRFRDGVFKAKIDAWYGALCDSWGFERLVFAENADDESYDLLGEDFLFLPFDFERDFCEIQNLQAEIAKEFSDNFFECEKLSVEELWKKDLFAFKSKNQQKIGIICKSASEEFVACALAVKILESESSCAILCDFFVVKKFRGLGIAQKLLENCLQEIKSVGLKTCFVSSAFLPKFLDVVFERLGFCRTNFGFKIDL